MTQIWAHRGASAYAPENTMEAFELALDQGAEGIEFDVQLTADGVPVVIHDERVDRTCDGEGWVCDKPLRELQRLDAGVAHDAFHGVQIPTFEEVLDLLVQHEVTINIELKNSVVFYPEIEEQVVDMVRRFGVEDRVLLSSFNHYSLKYAQSICEFPLGVIYRDPLFEPWNYAASLGMQAVHPPFRALHIADYVDDCHEAGIAVRPWIVNEIGDLEWMFALGVDAVFTDVPDVALRIRD